MKKTITQLLFAAVCCVVAISLSSCEKEGPIGPAGPIGPTGPMGPVGEPEEGGTFSAKVFDFYDVTIPAGIGTNLLLDFEVTKEEFENSMTHVYAAAGTNNANWLHMPGIGSGGQHIYRMWYAFPNGGANSRAIIQRSQGPADEAQSYTQMRIIVIPLNIANAMAAQGIDLSDFEAVKSAVTFK